jgi:ABC-type glutathione transport system ATPase component
MTGRGESGSGKSTTAQTVLVLETPTSDAVRVYGERSPTITAEIRPRIEPQAPQIGPEGPSVARYERDVSPRLASSTYSHH